MWSGGESETYVPVWDWSSLRNLLLSSSSALTRSKRRRMEMRDWLSRKVATFKKVRMCVMACELLLGKYRPHMLLAGDNIEKRGKE